MLVHICRRLPCQCLYIYAGDCPVSACTYMQETVLSLFVDICRRLPCHCFNTSVEDYSICTYLQETALSELVHICRILPYLFVLTCRRFPCHSLYIPAGDCTVTACTYLKETYLCLYTTAGDCPINVSTQEKLNRIDWYCMFVT